MNDLTVTQRAFGRHAELSTATSDTSCLNASITVTADKLHDCIKRLKQDWAGSMLLRLLVQRAAVIRLLMPLLSCLQASSAQEQSHQSMQSML